MTVTARSRSALTGATLLLALTACHTAGVAPTPRTALDDTAQINRDITYLASDALEGRGTGTPGNDSAAAYIARLYASLKLAPAEPSTGRDGCPTEFTEGFRCSPPYMQRFNAKSIAAAHAGLPSSLPTQNVVAVIPGTDPVLAKQYVVVGGHYDHLGRNAFSSMDPDSGTVIRHGADDNASGTAAVMTIARLFAKHPTKRSILLVNFSGEELGVLGSQYFVEHPPVPDESMIAMLNFDMVGRLREDKLIVQGLGTATQLRPLVDSVNTAVGHFQLAGMDDGYGPSDHSSFYGAGVPVLFFFTDTHDDYHRASDVASKINILGEARIIDYAVVLLRELGDRPDRLTYVKTKPPTRAGMGNGTWFGSVPDMGAVGVVGVRLSGVTPGSPAEAAGAKKGDIIVEFAGDPVKDIYEYTAALSKHKPGDVVQVVVLRDGQRVTLTVTLGRRPG